MAKTTPPTINVPRNKVAAHDIVPAGTVRKGLDVSQNDLVAQKLDELAQLLWFPEGISEKTKHTRIVRAVELYESLEPADGAEGMLAMQMVGTHDAALECLRRAALTNQTFEGRDMALKHAQKLMTLYTQQLATLNKHRGKGQQKVTVEHVNVEPGGQAIVGSVETGAVSRTQTDSTKDVTHGPTPPLEMPAEPRKSRHAKKG